MEGWSTCRLGELVTVKHGWPFKSEFFREPPGELPIVVAVGNFRYTGGFRFKESAVKGYAGDYPPEFDLRAGDILLVMTCQTAGGEILGVPARVPEDGRKYLHNQRLGRVQIDHPDKIDQEFLYSLFRWVEFNQHLFATSSGTKILHTAPSRIEDFTFALPPIEEQRSIASVLGALDDKIEANRALNETLEATCQALFRSWFIDFDPVVAKSEGRRPAHLTDEVAALFPDRFEDSPLGPVPAGWDIEPLDAIANYENGLALQNYRPGPGEPRLPVIKIAQLREGAPGNDEWASANIKENCVLDDGDVVFSWSGSLMVAIWCGGRGALNQHLFKVTSERFPKWFCHQWTLHHLSWFQGIAADKATTMGHIRRHHLTEAACVVPSPTLIDAADRLLGPILEHYVSGRTESRTLTTLRDALLPRLLSGELRVRQAEKLVEEAV